MTSRSNRLRGTSPPRKTLTQATEPARRRSPRRNEGCSSAGIQSLPLKLLCHRRNSHGGGERENLGFGVSSIQTSKPTKFRRGQARADRAPSLQSKTTFWGDLARADRQRVSLNGVGFRYAEAGHARTAHHHSRHFWFQGEMPRPGTRGSSVPSLKAFSFRLEEIPV